MRRQKRLILILGGARSGKSAYAEELAGRVADSDASAAGAAASPKFRGAGDHAPMIYLATATAPDGDEEMRRRIASHQRSRGDGWITIEEPLDPAAALTASGKLDLPGAVILLDCLTLLVSNLLLGGPSATEEPGTTSEADIHTDIDWPAREKEVGKVIGDLLATYHAGSATLICVSNEVGMGLVPPYPLGRAFRDILGRVNARIAGEADVVLLMLAGLAVEVKSLADAWNAAAAMRLGLDR